MSCSTDYDYVYKQLAEFYALSKEEPDKNYAHLKSAMNVVLDLTTDTNDSAVDITGYLFGWTHKAYLYMYRFPQTDTHVLTAVKLINKYVTERCEEDLTGFVNGISWSRGCIPREWQYLCERVRVDTSNWNVCSIS